MNRPTLRERELLTLLSAIMAMTALGIDLLLPAFDEIRDAYGLGDDSNRPAQVITVFFFGLAVAQLFWGPIVDRFGRKRSLYLAVGVYVASAVGSAVAPTFEWLLVSRFVWGLGAAGARVVAMAIIRDLFEGEKMAKAMSNIMAVFVLVPVFAPAAGAGLIIVLPWRSIFWFSAICALAVAAWSLRLSETLAPENQRPLELASIVSGFRKVVGTRLTLGYTLATLFLQGIFTAYLGSSERIISDIFNRGDQFPIVFGAVAVLFGVGALINGQIVGIVGVDRLIRIVLVLVLLIGGLLAAIALVSEGKPNFWVFMPVLGVLLMLFMFLVPNMNTRALEPMGELAGTASSLTGAIRTAGGALLGALVDSRVGDSVTPFTIAIVVFGVASAASAAYGSGQSRAVRNPEVDTLQEPVTDRL